MLNNVLRGLYEQKSAALFTVTRQICNASGPFLITATDRYEQSKFKIAYVGRETHGWESKPSVKDQMQYYQSFFGDASDDLPLGSPYWSFITKLETALNLEKLSSAWLNLNRFDVNETSPIGQDLEQIMQWDWMLLEELKILQPDAVVFVTAHAYDPRLSALLQGIKHNVENIDPRLLSSWESPHFSFPLLRTYHPKYLRMRGHTDKVLSAIQKILNA